MVGKTFFYKLKKINLSKISIKIFNYDFIIYKISINYYYLLKRIINQKTLKKVNFVNI